MDKKLFTLTSSPHLKTAEDTRSIMLDVIIALTPALVVSGLYFGYRAFLITIVCVASCIVGEYFSRKIMKRSTTIGDLSAVVTGVLLAFNLPVTVPLWIPVVGGLFAMIIVKQLFGGLGQNFMNPALAARVFLMMSWTSIMTTWANPVSDWGKSLTMADAVTSATPLMTLKSGAQPNVSVFELLLGSRGGSLGETCALLLIVGGIYLVIRKVILPHTPLAFIGTVALLTYLFPQSGMDRMSFMLTEIFSGGLMLGAIFMATDYATTPVTPVGKIIFGVGCGLLTVLIRYFGGYPEGVSFSIILMNIMTGFIDQWTRPRIFGGGAKLGKAKKTV